uniref:DUF834 domain-containing protein n=1 Tax=Oryza glumipatula TaxID=40148 RepID=A0A0D9ZJ13_9ORYZ
MSEEEVEAGTGGGGDGESAEEMGRHWVESEGGGDGLGGRPAGGGAATDLGRRRRAVVWVRRRGLHAVGEEQAARGERGRGGGVRWMGREGLARWMGREARAVNLAEEAVVRAVHGERGACGGRGHEVAAPRI